MCALNWLQVVVSTCDGFQPHLHHLLEMCTSKQLRLVRLFGFAMPKIFEFAPTRQQARKMFEQERDPPTRPPEHGRLSPHMHLDCHR